MTARCPFCDSALPSVEEQRQAIADFFQEALDETADIDPQHRYHTLRVKILSRISALTDPAPGERWVREQSIRSAEGGTAA